MPRFHSRSHSVAKPRENQSVLMEAMLNRRRFLRGLTPATLADEARPRTHAETCRSVEFYHPLIDGEKGEQKD
jgi:hypothetical protein